MVFNVRHYPTPSASNLQAFFRHTSSTCLICYLQGNTVDLITRGLVSLARGASCYFNYISRWLCRHRGSNLDNYALRYILITQSQSLTSLSRAQSDVCVRLTPGVVFPRGRRVSRGEGAERTTRGMHIHASVLCVRLKLKKAIQEHVGQKSGTDRIASC